MYEGIIDVPEDVDFVVIYTDNGSQSLVVEKIMQGSRLERLSSKATGKNAVTMTTYSLKAVIEAVRSYLQAIMQS